MKQGTQPIRSASELIERARGLKNLGHGQRIAVAAAQDPDVLDAVFEASTEGIVEPYLFGDRDKINALSSELGLDASRFKIFHHPDTLVAAREAVAFADSGEADIIMKGFVSSSVLLKAVLSREFSLRCSDTLSHVAVLDIPGYHKLLSLTDGGVLVRPDLQQKVHMIENFLSVARALGIETPKVALLGPPVEGAAPESLLRDSQEITEKFALETPRRAVVEGPMSLDCILSREVAARRGLQTAVSGDADAIVVNAIEECNVVAKSVIVLAGAVFAGVVVGARLPVSMVSRTDTRQNKKASIAIASLVSASQKKWG
jgi:phosphate butyryltransferase